MEASHIGKEFLRDKCFSPVLFFCSELIAKCYKVCGIMKPTDEASSNFLPGDFTTQSDRLKLVDGAKLGSEMNI